MKVDFVIGGTQKGGTSALDAFLRQHPQICMPHSKKEVHFFDNEANFAGTPNYKKYHGYFAPRPEHRAIGDATPVYMYWETAPRRIWSYNPDMKWIIALRNPVERAFSAWNMERDRKIDPLDFRAAIAQEAARCRAALPLQHLNYSYVDRGFYAAQVRRLFNIFGRENCLVLLNEDLRTDHVGTLARVFEFLGVDATVSIPSAEVFHHSYATKLEDDLRRQLVDTFRNDIRDLERLLERDLSAWFADRAQ